jgi:hypothetical protein
MEPKGRGTIEYLPELRRIPLPRTRVNKNLKLDGASLKTLARRGKLGPIKSA